MRASGACGRARGRRKARKEEKQEEGGSVERAVGHIIKGIRLSEYFRDTIKRLLYGDRELSALFVSSRYSPFLSLSLPHLPLLRGARSPTGVQEARLHSHPGARHLRSPVTWPEATRCNLPVRTRYHPLPIPPAGGSYTCTGGYGVQRLFFAAAKLHQLESEATAAISPFYNVSGCLPPSNLSLLFFVSSNRGASQVFRVSLTFQSFWLFEPEIPCIVVPLLPP